MRRELPPLNALKAFEASARHLSFTKAAKELHVSQAAISHQIKHLEERLNIKLFRRLNRALLLTEEGQLYAPAVREALDKLAIATEAITSRTHNGTLTVSVLPSFATKWLVPRLWKFHDRYPDLDVRVSAFEWLVDFNKVEVDLAIRYGLGNWPGLHAEHLLSEDVFPVCSPELLEGKHPLKTPSDLQYHMLLHDEYSREDWKAWLAHTKTYGIKANRGLRFSHTSIMLEAAESSQGVALGRSSLVADDLAKGRLVKPFDLFLPAEYSYYIVCNQLNSKQAKIEAFREWALQEARSQYQVSETKLLPKNTKN